MLMICFNDIEHKKENSFPSFISTSRRLQSFEWNERRIEKAKTFEGVNEEITFISLIWLFLRFSSTLALFSHFLIVIKITSRNISSLL